MAGYTAPNPLILLPGPWQDRLAEAHVCPIDGGICNRVYRVDADEARYALRVNNPEPARLGLDPDREARVLDAIKGQSWAPHVAYQSPQVLLTRWEEGKPPVGGAGTRLDWLAHALARVHSQFANLPRIDIPMQLRILADRCDNQAEAIHRRLDSLLADYHPPAMRTLCHHDWHPGNLIITRTGWTLLDWEFAGLGDPCLDVGSAINGFALPPGALKPLSQLTGYGVQQLEQASVIMKALEIIWFAANPELKADASASLSNWLKEAPNASSASVQSP